MNNKIKLLKYIYCFFKTAVCGPTSLMVTNKTQVLTSPNYPNAYGNNLICRWFLLLEPPNTVISLRFTELDLENTTDCSSDYLEIYYTQVNKQKFKYLIKSKYVQNAEQNMFINSLGKYVINKQNDI